MSKKGGHYEGLIFCPTCGTVQGDVEQVLQWLKEGVSQAVRCPVCNGAGKIWTVAAKDSTACNMEVTCHGCGGKGWVVV